LDGRFPATAAGARRGRRGTLGVETCGEGRGGVDEHEEPFGIGCELLLRVGPGRQESYQGVGWQVSSHNRRHAGLSRISCPVETAISRRQEDSLRDLTDSGRQALLRLSRSQAAPAVELTRAWTLLAIAVAAELDRPEGVRRGRSRLPDRTLATRESGFPTARGSGIPQGTAARPRSSVPRVDRGRAPVLTPGPAPAKLDVRGRG
jgi:hypothetical protein